jgi:hypothetical protein
VTRYRQRSKKLWKQRGLRGKKITGGGSHVAVGTGVHVPLPRQWWGERRGAERGGERVLIPHSAWWSQDTAEDLVTRCTKARRRSGSTEPWRDAAVRVLPIRRGTVQSRDRGVATLKSQNRSAQ